MKREKIPGTLGLSSSSRVFIICSVISFLIPVTACIGLSPTAWMLVLLRAPDFGILLLWLLAAVGFGAAILKAIGLHLPMTRALGIVTSIALGFGVISLLVLLIGLCTRVSLPLAWGILILGWALAVWAKDLWMPAPRKEPAAEPYRWLMLMCASALGLACLGALVPPGVLWGDEPNGYDVLEYHLQVPREWYELGRIVPLRHNVFSYFPFNVEMHYLLAMGLRGGPWSGMYLAQSMHVAFIALTVAAVYALIAARSKPMAFIAAAAVATVPWMGLLAPVAYDEGGLLLWGTLAIGLSLRGSDDWRSMTVAGVMAGFACGSKLTAIPTVLLAIPVVHVLLARFKSSALICAAAFFLSGIVIFSPWLIKNLAWVGNPVFPEQTAMFGHGEWSPTQVERWVRANHLPRMDQQNLTGRAVAGWNQIVGDWRFNYGLLPLAIISAIISRKNRKTKALISVLMVLAAFWLFFTHLQSRFFTLAIPISALLIGQVQPMPKVSLAYALVISLLGLGGLLAVCQKLASRNADLKSHLFDFIGMENLNGLTPLADTIVATDTGVVMIGDGRPFLYNVPTNRLFYRTVFDVDAKPGEASDDAWRSGSEAWSGPIIEVIDSPELRRLTNYWAIPLPSAEVMKMQAVTVRSLPGAR